MKGATQREKLQDYIRFADDKKIDAIYTLVKQEIEPKSGPWEDPAFLEGLEQTVKEYKRDKSNLSTWEEIKAKLHNGK